MSSSEVLHQAGSAISTSVSLPVHGGTSGLAKQTRPSWTLSRVAAGQRTLINMPPSTPKVCTASMLNTLLINAALKSASGGGGRWSSGWWAAARITLVYIKERWKHQCYHGDNDSSPGQWWMIPPKSPGDSRSFSVYLPILRDGWFLYPPTIEEGCSPYVLT